MRAKAVVVGLTVLLAFVMLPQGLEAQWPTSLSVVASSNSSTYGAPVTLTATVSLSSATGNVTFYAGATVLGVSPVAVADHGNSRIRQVTPAGTITTIAGTGSYLDSGDGGPATNAGVNAYSVAVDSFGNIYLDGPAQVRKISPNGIITTVAGTGHSGYSGNNGPATSAEIGYTIGGLAVDPAGNLYI